jgi:mono/diheme cytochrome c family protein
MNPRLKAIIILLLSGGILAGQTSPQVKKAPVKETSPASGKEMYIQYCASCHGKDGKGDGPAASALKVAPSNLATLSARNNGTFPEIKISRIIEGNDDLAAHGSRDMPTWGQVFHQMEGGGPATGKLRVANLTAYLKSLQGK